MLEKSQRIRLEYDYKFILSKGKKYYSQLFLMSVVPGRNGSEIPSRFGFITSKKVGKANIRNRLRRQFREVIRLNINNIRNGYDIVIIVSPKSVGEKYSNIENQLLQQLRFSRLMK